MDWNQLKKEAQKDTDVFYLVLDSEAEQPKTNRINLGQSFRFAFQVLKPLHLVLLVKNEAGIFCLCPSKFKSETLLSSKGPDTIPPQEMPGLLAEEPTGIGEAIAILGESPLILDWMPEDINAQTNPYLISADELKSVEAITSEARNRTLFLDYEIGRENGDLEGRLEREKEQKIDRIKAFMASHPTEVDSLLLELPMQERDVFRLRQGVRVLDRQHSVDEVAKILQSTPDAIANLEENAIERLTQRINAMS
jgi:hypothetical protein